MSLVSVSAETVERRSHAVRLDALARNKALRVKTTTIISRLRSQSQRPVISTAPIILLAGNGRYIDEMSDRVIAQLAG
jgi:hypothetical protein